MTRDQQSRMAFVNPISDHLHAIPALCPICGKKQWDGLRSYDEEAPYGGGEEGITDLKLGVETTVCHTSCLYWFRDEAVNWLIELGTGDYGIADEAYNEMLIAEYNKLHEAIRDALFEGGIHQLIESLLPNYFLIRGWFRQ